MHCDQFFSTCDVHGFHFDRSNFSVRIPLARSHKNAYNPAVEARRLPQFDGGRSLINPSADKLMELVA
jgi:hypothetical protein